MWAGILMMLPSINAVNASGIKSMATDMAVAQGMGKGEFYTCEPSPAFSAARFRMLCLCRGNCRVVKNSSAALLCLIAERSWCLRGDGAGATRRCVRSRSSSRLSSTQR